MIKSKTLKTFLVLTLAIFIIVSSLFSIPVQANGSDLFSKDNLETLAKGILSLYLINRLNSLITEDKNMEEKIGNQVSIDYSGLNNHFSLSSIDGKIIVIDPGHGGSDPGAVGRGGLKEKDVTLDIAKRVYQLLKENTNAQVYLTRDTDRYVSLSQRSSMANKLGADAFISIHINGAENGIERGIETYAHYNSPKNAWALAWYIQEKLVEELGLLDRGLKADNFHVVRETNMDSVLLEIGFITDTTEETLLAKSSTRERAARAVFEGILEYYQNK